MSWEVKYYPKETEKFLNALSKVDFTKIGQEFDILSSYGFSRPNTALKKMAGLANIWELKVKEFRIFLLPIGQTFQILGTITKKSNKTPRETIMLIKNRAKLWQ